MASKRRGGFRAPELRGTLGTLLRTTTGVVRDALERGAREGRARLDGARASRRRHDALADLGELVLDLIRRGEIDLAELPEARDLVRELDDLDDDTATADPAALTNAEPDLPRPSTRRRFDDRGRRDDRRDDGTVSSGATARADRADRSERYTIPDRPRSGDTSSSRASTRPMKGALRPTFDDLSNPDHRTRIERWDATRTDRIGRPDRLDHTAQADGERERSQRTAERERAERADRSPASERERERTEPRTAADKREHRERTSPDHSGLDQHGYPDRRDDADHRDHPDHRDHAGHRDHPDHRDHADQRDDPNHHDHADQRDTSGPGDRPDHRDALGRKDRQAHRASTDRDRPDPADHDRSDHRDPADHGSRPDHRNPADHGSRPDHRDTDHLERPASRSPLPRDPTRKGGISFDDEDLADYMHPDDVPAKLSSKPPPPDPDDHDA